MKEREALKQALENYMAAFGQALEAHGIELQQQQIEADRGAREALAQPERVAYQEPVAWMTTEVTTGTQVWLYKKTAERYQNPPTPLYTTPPQRKPLTDEEIERLIFQSGGHKSTQNLMSNPMQVREHVELWNERIYKFARAIEAAHGIKE